MAFKPPFKFKPPHRWVAVAGITVLSLIAVAGFSLAVYAAWLFHDLPDAAELANYHPPTASRVFAWDGTLIGEYSKERRIYVPYNQMPPRLVNAFLAAEDHNFFHHGGIDVGGVSRAMLKDVANAARGRRFEGGSTITQQVAKNILLNNDATIGRKLKEAILAHRLEQRLTKERILELYLNEIWLGYRSYGVGAAAYNYFGKSLDQLTLEECAYLAALPKGPDNYQPVRHKAQAIERRNWILGQMESFRWITPQQAQLAEAADLKVNLAPMRSKYTYADFFVEEVRRRAVQMPPFGQHLTEGGYYIRTTLDSTLQQEARDALMGGLEQYDRRHGWRGPLENLPVEAGWQKQALTHHAPSERDTWRVAMVDAIQGGNVHVTPATGEPGGPLAPEDVTWAKAGKGALKVGDIVFVDPGKGNYRLKQIPLVNGALVVIDPQSGRVLAMVGGYSYSLSNFNRATQAMRQPGSAFKPFVYATALQNGFTPASVVVDGPITLKGANGQDWTPENYEHDFLGPLVLRRGIELSRNTMTVRLAQAIGMKKIVDNAIKFGVVTDMAPVLSMALGAGETTPLKLAGAYSAFINGGRKVDTHLIELVQDRDGKTVFRADHRACPRCKGGFTGEESPRLPPLGTEVLDPITAYQMTSFLQGVVQRGTAAAASSLGRPLGGKTGTTNEYRSAWFIGFSPDIIAGTFIGFDDNRSLGEHETGAVAALPVFMGFMKQALKDTPVHDFKPPKEARFAMVNGIREAFRPGTEPHGDVSYGQDGLPVAAPDTLSAPGVVTPPPPPGPRAPPADLNGLF